MGERLLKGRLRDLSGLSLPELLVAVALIGIGFMAAVQTFSIIQKSIQGSKNRTIATNIAQEKIQTIMQKSYYEVLVTTSPQFMVIGSSMIAYDNAYFPPETVIEGGVRYTRYTAVDVAQDNSGAIELLPPTTPDTGMRQVTETVTWTAGNDTKFVSIKSLVNNPNTVMSIAVLTGVIRDSNTLAAIPGALVTVAENVGWRDTANSSGTYSINLSPGTFNFMVSASGYATRIITLTIPPYVTTTYNINLQTVSTGTISGAAWINNHLMVSQVVASTDTGGGTEYIELYNPTTAPILIGSGAQTYTRLYIFDKDNQTVPTSGMTPVSLTYISTYVPTNSYYLIANTAVVRAGGVNRSADATYSGVSAPTHLIPQDEAGGLGIASPAPDKIDAISWSKTSSGHTCPDMPKEGSCYPSGNGLSAGDQFIRHVDTTSVLSSSYGNAYDGDDNSKDFFYNSPILIAPRTVATQLTPKAGVPAYGAIVSVTDGLSVPSSATQTGNPPYAYFTIPNVATGTWNVFIDSIAASTEIDSVTVSALGITWIPNTNTSPSWPGSGTYGTILTTSGVMGIITGTVKDSAGQPISGNLSVSAGNTSTQISGNGTYYLRLSTGTYDVVANPSNNNSLYASTTRSGVFIGLGDLANNIDFNLSKGGRITGWVTRDGTNSLPGITVVALDSNGIERDTEVSGSNGRYTLVNLTTGTYTVQPILDSKEVATPSTSTVNVTAGVTTSASTFTITGAMGTVTGTVRSGTTVIPSGVLIIISTSAVSIPPPTLSSATTASTAYYSDSSSEDGTFSVDVRGSTTTTYNASAFYMYVNGNTPVISSKTVSNITVTPGQTTSGINFTW